MDERDRSNVTLTPRQPLPERTNRAAVEIKTSVAPEDLRQLGDFAREIGASDAVAIEARAMAVSEAMRLKCQIPTCWGYNSSPFCPPRSATAEEIRSIIGDYQWALLLHIPRPSNGDGSYAKLIEHVNRLKEIVGRTEVEAQYSGFVDSMGFTGGPCTLCGMFSEQWAADMKARKEVPYCPLLARTSPICLHYYHVRPAAQAVGIDMYLTARNARWADHLYPPEPVVEGRTDWPCLPGVYPVLIK